MLATIEQIANKHFDYVVIGKFQANSRAEEPSEKLTRSYVRRRSAFCLILFPRHGIGRPRTDRFLLQNAGLTLSARLTEDKSLSVLVLEAGDANLGDPEICEYRLFRGFGGR